MNRFDALPGLVLTALVGCAHHSPPPATIAPAEVYARAVADAAEPTESEIVNSLLAITPSTPSLSWDGEPGARAVRVVTWTSWNGYDAHVGETIPLGREVWATVVPDLRDRCRALGISGEALTRRLEAMLGLPPASGKTRFVELSVAPTDMFRPCPDPEVDDTTCALEFAGGVDAEHRAWIEALRQSSYGASGYPWTQLGYTYDWGTSAPHVGPSEFVVRAGASARVIAVETTDAYCTLGASEHPSPVAP